MFNIINHRCHTNSVDIAGQNIILRKRGAFIVKSTDFRQLNVQILILLKEQNDSAKGYIHAFRTFNSLKH